MGMTAAHATKASNSPGTARSSGSFTGGSATPGRAPTAPAAALADAPAIRAPAAQLLDVRRALLPELVRITLEINREVPYHDQRVGNSPQIVFELPDTVPAPALHDTELPFLDDVVRRIRVTQPRAQTTRVLLNVEGIERYSVFTLYNPYRLVIDLVRRAGTRPDVKPAAPPPTFERDESREPTASSNVTATAPDPSQAGGRGVRQEILGKLAHREAPTTTGGATPATPAVLPSSAARPTTTPNLPAPRAPEAPAANASGSFSLARQLGLGVSRIVIDPGHGGHDPGALGRKITEAELVLDIALRLEKLLQKNPAFDVTLTRRTNVFVPLEERTAMANRAKADLFLSIHANASRNSRARGIETYVLNFATNPEAEAVAARENAASARSMHQLGDIVRAIALNNKLDESREFARIVQSSLTRRLRAGDAALRDLGVKQAPFVVLIGASMPSVLAEISFVTNPYDAQLLRTGAQRQKIAESLYEAVANYQRTLKAVETVASQ
jgi:N-acetylmuramoyl-L-alanine amidase